MQKPSVGRMVHYCLSAGSREGEIRPAVITRVDDDGSVNLDVWYDGPNDREYLESCDPLTARWVGTVPYAESPTPGHWSWPPRV